MNDCTLNIYPPSFDSKKWLETFKANYAGTTEEAKDLEPFIKSNYKGNSYIPWATMERLIYQQDPNARIDVRLSFDGTPLHTSKFTVRTVNNTSEKHSVTEVDGFSHFVVVEVEFLGKTVVEYMPIQDNSYNANKVIDQNQVNKSIQRAKAKACARVSGLALKLYEGGDLQFEDDGAKPTTPPVINKETQPEPQKEPQKEKKQSASEVVEQVKEVGVSKEHLELAKHLKDNAATLSKGTEKINVMLEKKFGKTIDLNATVEDIAAVLLLLPRPDITVKSIEQQSKGV